MLGSPPPRTPCLTPSPGRHDEPAQRHPGPAGLHGAADGLVEPGLGVARLERQGEGRVGSSLKKSSLRGAKTQHKNGFLKPSSSQQSQASGPRPCHLNRYQTVRFKVQYSLV